jgi:hypothetical protein
MLLVRAMVPDVPEDHNMRRRGSKVHCSYDVAAEAVFTRGGLSEAFGLRMKERAEHVLMAHGVLTAHSHIDPLRA